MPAVTRAVAVETGAETLRHALFYQPIDRCEVGGVIQARPSLKVSSPAWEIVRSRQNRRQQRRQCLAACRTWRRTGVGAAGIVDTVAGFQVVVRLICAIGCNPAAAGGGEMARTLRF